MNKYDCYKTREVKLKYLWKGGNRYCIAFYLNIEIYFLFIITTINQLKRRYSQCFQLSMTG